MKNTKNNFAVLRNAMKNMKPEIYALKNPVTSALDEFTKNLYLKMLCTVAQYDNESSEMQTLFLNRILKGIGLEEPLTEYMRRALEISEQDFKDFIDSMKEGEAKYYFALEAILVAQLGNKETKMDYVAELLEVCFITKQDVEYISLIAKSILKQDAAVYDAAKPLVSEAMLSINFQPYIENYYIGAIIDRERVKCYSAPSIDIPTEIEFPTEYTAEKVSFKNLHIHLTEEWYFENCEEVVFINCKFTQEEDSYFGFESVGSIVIKDCEFKGFTRRTAFFTGIDNITIDTSYFNNCGIRDKKNEYAAGIFAHLLIDPKSEQFCKSLIFVNNIVKNCYVDTQNSTGVLLDAIGFDAITCSNNTFLGCQCGESPNNKAIIANRSSSDSHTICENNILKGGVTRMFELD